MIPRRLFLKLLGVSPAIVVALKLKTAAKPPPEEEVYVAPGRYFITDGYFGSVDGDFQRYAIRMGADRYHLNGGPWKHLS